MPEDYRRLSIILHNLLGRVNYMISIRRVVFSSFCPVLLLVLSSCASMPTGPANPPMRVDAGLLDQYSLDGTYDRFARSHGFMLVTFGGKLAAMSAQCPQDSQFLVKDGRGLKCPVDGGEFNEAGNVKTGPGHEALVRYVMWIDSSRHVYVDTSKPLIEPLWRRTDSYLMVR